MLIDAMKYYADDFLDTSSHYFFRTRLFLLVASLKYCLIPATQSIIKIARIVMMNFFFKYIKIVHFLVASNNFALFQNIVKL